MFVAVAVALLRRSPILMAICLLPGLLALTQSCGSGSGIQPDRPATEVEDADAISTDLGGSSRQTPQVAPPAGVAAPNLPAPSQLARSSSSLDPEFYVYGSYLDYSVVHQHNVTTIQATKLAVFEPDFDDNDSGLGGTAYGAYTIATRKAVNGNKQIRLWCTESPLHPENIHLAIANFKSNRWEWFSGFSDIPSFGMSKDLVQHYDDYLSPDGNIHAVVLVVGHGSVSLKGIQVGEPLWYSSPQAVPDNADNELTTTIKPGIGILGDSVYYYEYDLDDNGTWDEHIYEEEVPGGELEHTFSSKGIHHIKIRAHAVASLDTSPVRDVVVYVTDPNNIGPTALLHADVSSGDAPLTVTLDGSDSFDDDKPSSKIVKVEWDMDDDGYYELDTGTDLTTTATLVRNGMNKLRMRVTDNDLDHSGTSVSINVNGGWAIDAIPGSVLPHYAGMDLKLIGAQQKPALAYVPDGGLGKIQYVAATNSTASGWQQHYFVNVEEGAQYAPRLATVSGNPAVVYTNARDSDPDGSYELRYARANTAAGDSWAASTIISPFSQAFEYTDLEIVNGKPAVVMADQQSHAGLYLIRALDADGAAWLDGELIYESHYVNNFSMPRLLSLPGQPLEILFGLVATEDGERGGLMRASFDDEDGAALAGISQLWDNYSPQFDLAQMGGKLLLALRGEEPGYDSVNFQSLSSLDAGPITDPLVLDPRPRNSGISISLCSLDGRPMIIFIRANNEGNSSQFDENIYMLLADDAAASDWAPEMQVIGGVGYQLKALTMLDAKPLMTFADVVNNNIVAARWLAP